MLPKRHWCNADRRSAAGSGVLRTELKTISPSPYAQYRRLVIVHCPPAQLVLAWVSLLRIGKRSVLSRWSEDPHTKVENHKEGEPT